MFSDKKFLLVGNSRLHWAEHYQNQYNFTHTNKNYTFNKNFDFQNLIWATVGNYQNILLEKKNEIKTKDIKLPNLPEYFGVDRGLACLAVLKIIENPLKKDLLIADCGTILSLTKIKANGSILGGQLVPGFLTQLRSMESATKNLKFPEKCEIPTEYFSIKTEDAILKGVIQSLSGVINGAFNPSRDILITCGGDSHLITKYLNDKNRNIIKMPNLVMEGMIMHYKHLHESV